MTARSEGEALFHSGALLAWLAAALLPSVLTRHPLYLLAALALVGLVHGRLARHAPAAAAWGGFARFALLFVLFALAFNVLLGGRGETPLLTLPAWRRLGEDGTVLFQLGGAVTLETVVWSLTTAAALLLVVFALAAFNALVDHDQLLRGLPAVLHQTATVVSIALTFLPQLAEAQREIREAQALRGHRPRGPRDVLPLVLTLLAEALDRAMALAESMEARGFSGPPGEARGRRRARLAIALGLALVLAGLLLRGLGLAATAGAVVAAAGGVLLALVLVRLGRATRRSRLRREPWRRRDTALVVASLATVAALAVLALADGELLRYQPFPRIAPPTLDGRVLAALLPIAAPALLAPPPEAGG